MVPNQPQPQGFYRVTGLDARGVVIFLGYLRNTEGVAAACDAAAKLWPDAIIHDVRPASPDAVYRWAVDAYSAWHRAAESRRLYPDSPTTPSAEEVAALHAKMAATDAVWHAWHDEYGRIREETRA